MSARVTVRKSGQPCLPHVIFVTGKGGTGKSTVAAALALALARHGSVSLIDLDRRRSAIKALGSALNGNDDAITTIALTARGELEAFIERIVPLRALARRMLRSRTFGFVSTALPGLEAFLMLERLRLAAKEEAAPGHFIVVDGPATGGALELLGVPAGVQRLAPLGTLHRLAAEAEAFVRNADQFGVLLATRAEQLGVREAIEAKTALDTLGVRCLGVVLNACETELFTEADLAALATLGAHRRIAQARHEAAASVELARRQLRRAGLHPVNLPMLHRAALGAAEFTRLANLLAGAFSG